MSHLPFTPYITPTVLCAAVDPSNPLAECRPIKYVKMIAQHNKNGFRRQSRGVDGEGSGPWMLKQRISTNGSFSHRYEPEEGYYVGYNIIETTSSNESWEFNPARVVFDANYYTGVLREVGSGSSSFRKTYFQSGGPPVELPPNESSSDSFDLSTLEAGEESRVFYIEGPGYSVGQESYHPWWNVVNLRGLPDAAPYSAFAQRTANVSGFSNAIAYADYNYAGGSYWADVFALAGGQVTLEDPYTDKLLIELCDDKLVKAERPVFVTPLGNHFFANYDPDSGWGVEASLGPYTGVGVGEVNFEDFILTEAEVAALPLASYLARYHRLDQFREIIEEKFLDFDEWGFTVDWIMVEDPEWDGASQSTQFYECYKSGVIYHRSRPKLVKLTIPMTHSEQPFDEIEATVKIIRSNDGELKNGGDFILAKDPGIVIYMDQMPPDFIAEFKFRSVIYEGDQAQKIFQND